MLKYEHRQTGDQSLLIHTMYFSEENFIFEEEQKLTVNRILYTEPSKASSPSNMKNQNEMSVSK